MDAAAKRTEGAETIERLFTYGTLSPEQPPKELADVLEGFVYVGDATVRAQIFQLQAYPGLVLDEDAEPVKGRLFDLPAASWARLDEYEGFDPKVKESSLFVRTKTTVARDHGAAEEVWIYVYNRHP